MSFGIYSRKTGKYLNQNFFAGSWPGIVWMKNYLSNFGSAPLTWLKTLPSFLVKIFQILWKVMVFFPERGEEIKTSFWHSWIAQWLKFFLTTAYFFSILAILKKRGVKFEPKVLILGPSLFHKYSNTLKRFSNSVCVC